MSQQPSYALAWADNGKLNLVSGSGDIQLLDASSGKQEAGHRLVVSNDLPIRLGLSPGPVGRFIWGPGGKLLARVVPKMPFGISISDLTLWDAASGKEVLVLRSGWSVVKPQILQQGDNATGCSPAWDPSGQRPCQSGTTTSGR
jgi:hypothetical protein